MPSPTLREELAAPPEPRFDLTLPPGWSRREPDEGTQAAMVADLKRRMMHAQRPDLFAQLRPALDESFEQMRSNGVIAFFAPTEPDPGTLWLPASINASIRRAEPGGNLDDLARTLIRDRGALPLLGDKRTLRFEQTETRRDGDVELVSHSRVYLTPVPGARRRRALQLVAGFASTPDMAQDAPELERMRALFDACVASIRWTAGGAAG
jgi:hypothetical protein